MKNNHKLLNTGFLFALLLCPVFFTGCTNRYTSANFWNGIQKDQDYVSRHFKSAEKIADVSEQNSLYDEPEKPFLKDRNQKFRIGVVVSSGDYWEFFDNLKGLIEGFSSIGWAKRINVPDSCSECYELIELLNQTPYSDYIEFVPEYFVNLKWGDNVDQFNEKYIKHKPDVDVIIAYGGMAAKLFYNNQDYPVPVLGDAITDSIDAGLAVSVEDSGRSFYTGKIDPELYLQQLRIFHQATGFKKLGIVYGDDEFGRVYGAVAAIEAVAGELGFEIIRNTNVKEEIADDTVDLYLAALNDVAAKSDAVYIGASTAVTEYDITPQIVEILNRYKKPSFALEGSIRVKDGILYSFSAKSTIRGGIWVATKISHIFAGVEPSALSQRFENVSSMAVNVDTAEKIEYKVPFEIISNSDEIYIDQKGTAVSLNDDLDAVMDAQVEIVYTPRRKLDGTKYRVAIVASGEYWEFANHLSGIINGLKSTGWLKDSVKPAETDSLADVYSSIGANPSDFIEFPVEYFLNLNWGEANMEKARRLAAGNDVDLIIAFGGVAGKIYSSAANLKVPVLIEAVTDPVGSGIIYASSDSGSNNITCRIDTTQYRRQIELFQELIGFEKLGIVYGDNDEGRLYSAVNDVELMALKNGFEIVRNTNVKEYTAPDTVSLYLAALKDVASRADAVYIGASTAITEYDITDKVAKILEEAGVPSFALEGEIRVKDGILMGISSVESEKIGLYNANKIEAIFYGVIPRLLDQNFTGFPSIAMNLETARKLGLDLPLETLASIDILY
ncbi:MAG: hypothetical protein MJ196_06750 [Treponemataceae bacterium]|nr:hypothetical protein [Treponemataceae bacterium]